MNVLFQGVQQLYSRMSLPEKNSLLRSEKSQILKEIVLLLAGSNSPNEQQELLNDHLEH